MISYVSCGGVLRTTPSQSQKHAADHKQEGPEAISSVECRRNDDGYHLRLLLLPAAEATCFRCRYRWRAAFTASSLLRRASFSAASLWLLSCCAAPPASAAAASAAAAASSAASLPPLRRLTSTSCSLGSSGSTHSPRVGHTCSITTLQAGMQGVEPWAFNKHLQSPASCIRTYMHLHHAVHQPEFMAGKDTHAAQTAASKGRVHAHTSDPACLLLGPALILSEAVWIQWCSPVHPMSSLLHPFSILLLPFPQSRTCRRKGLLVATNSL